MPAQMVKDKRPERTDHVFYRRGKADYKCVLCGACCGLPPAFPTPADWMPRCYEALTECERKMCPPR